MDNKKERMDSGVSSSSSSSAVDSSESEDLFEEVNSSSPPTCGSSGSDSSSNFQPLQDMSSLLEGLPVKRGLSKYYNGKSQSFTSLSNVRGLEDLAKPENQYNKKLKSCRSYGGLFLEGYGGEEDGDGPRRSKSSSRLVANKTGSAAGRPCSSSLLSGKRSGSGFIGNRPPPIPPPHRSARSSSFLNQAPLLA